MLEECIQGRASSKNDEGRAGGDAGRVNVVVRSRFVLKIGAVGRFAAAGFFGILIMVRVSIDHEIYTSLSAGNVAYPVSPATDGCAACAVAVAGRGFDPASHLANGSASQREQPPRKLFPGTWGGQR